MVQESRQDCAAPKPVHTRSLYDLNTQQILSWDLNDSSIPCGKNTFSGSWGDPFADSAGALAGLNKQNPRQVRTETIHGFTAHVLEADGPDGKTKVWVDARAGLLLKTQFTPPNGEPRTILEITEVSYTAPPASIFAAPANCTAAAAPGVAPQ